MARQSLDLGDLYENWPYYVYNITPKSDPNQFNELATLQDFSLEQEIVSQGKINAAQRMRWLALLALGSCYVTYFMYMDWNEFYIPFTNWTLVLTTLSIIASIQASTDSSNFGKDALQTSETAIYVQARHHVLYTLSVLMNFICVGFYWFMLRDEQQEIHSSHEKFGWGRSVHLELIHSVPATATLVNVICTNTILRKENWKFITYLTILYGGVIWAFFLMTGTQQYSFLNFETGDAFKNLFWINLGAVIVYIIFCTLDENIKPINDATSIGQFTDSGKRRV